MTPRDPLAAALDLALVESLAKESARRADGMKKGGEFPSGRASDVELAMRLAVKQATPAIRAQALEDAADDLEELAATWGKDSPLARDKAGTIRSMAIRLRARAQQEREGR